MEKNIIVFNKQLKSNHDKTVLNDKEESVIDEIYDLLEDSDSKKSDVLSSIKNKVDEILANTSMGKYDEFYKNEREKYYSMLKEMYGKYYRVTTKNKFPYDYEFLFMPYMCIKANNAVAGIKIDIGNPEYRNSVEDSVLMILSDILYNDNIEYKFEEITEEEFRQTAITNSTRCLDARLKKMYERDTLTDLGYVYVNQYKIKENG